MDGSKHINELVQDSNAVEVTYIGGAFQADFFRRPLRMSTGCSKIGLLSAITRQSVRGQL